MFIELPNEMRVNTDHIISYTIFNLELQLNLIDGDIIELGYESLEDAKLALYALDRAIGVKPLIIRK